MSIFSLQYRNEHFIAGIDCENASGASYTGLSTRAGDLLTVRVKAQEKATLTAALMPDTMYIVLHSENVCQIGDGGVSVFD